MNFDEYSERGMVRRNIACEMMADRRIYEGSHAALTPHKIGIGAGGQ